jgi:hypothetical protein
MQKFLHTNIENYTKCTIAMKIKGPYHFTVLMYRCCQLNKISLIAEDSSCFYGVSPLFRGFLLKPFAR